MRPELYEQYKRLAHSIARRMCNQDFDLADQIAHDALVEVCLTKNRPKDDKSIDAYNRQVIANSIRTAVNTYSRGDWYACKIKHSYTNGVGSQMTKEVVNPRFIRLDDLEELGVEIPANREMDMGDVLKIHMYYQKLVFHGNQGVSPVKWGKSEWDKGWHHREHNNYPRIKQLNKE